MFYLKDAIMLTCLTVTNYYAESMTRQKWIIVVEDVSGTCMHVWFMYD